MKKILLYIFLFVYLYFFISNVYAEGFTTEEKSFCSLVYKIINIEDSIDEEYKNSSYSALLSKYSDIIDPYYRSVLIEQEGELSKNQIISLKEVLETKYKEYDLFINNNTKLSFLDCYPYGNKMVNKNNSVSITKVSLNDNYVTSNSIITLEGKGFNIGEDISISLVIGKMQYHYKSYKLISNIKLEIGIPDEIKENINKGVDLGISGFMIKYCTKRECVYSDEVTGILTKDPLSYEQYYLSFHNIINAKKIIKNPKKVVVAVIDDGISLNHPDLTNKIWVNLKEIPGNGTDDDKNGYVDDYNSWNFVYEGNNTVPLGTHGTTVAGIIGADTDNQEGIGGIIDNVELMSVGVCDNDGCLVENVINGIKYAVDNGANIINLSLGGHQFAGYNNLYDDALKYAYEKDIIIVVAGGNGDVLSNNSNGVNTKINKLSPVCNDGENYKNIIGVGSHDMNGYKSKWSNYGDCIDFYTTGESIFSSTFGEADSNFGESYNIFYGTSFSAPIITGIIGLGYEKYGKIDRFKVYDALTKSQEKSFIDAELYLNALGKSIGDVNIGNIDEKSNIQFELPQKYTLKIDKLFEALIVKLQHKSREEQGTFIKKLQSKISLLKNKKLSIQNQAIINYMSQKIDDLLLDLVLN